MFMLAADTARAQTVDAPHAAKNAVRTIFYKNQQYRFRFRLPASWTGYTILKEQWTGYIEGQEGGEREVEHGPLLIIRHPLWTEDDPREDIPIMILSHRQWRRVHSEEVLVSAAPFPPSELGHNAKWVFALPARYNYDLLTGFEEVDEIMKSNPLRGF